MTAIGRRRGARVRGRIHDQIRLPRISREAGWVWAAVFAFLAMSAWWLSQDDRVPDWDTGAHLVTAESYYSYLLHGHLTLPFTQYDTYPPLVHLVGALSGFVAGVHPMAMILSSNIVFVPLLAFGCFGVGRIAYGPRAGVLAAVLALGSPMFISTMRMYELDPPQAAMVAISLWAILASRRFERVGISALAGVLTGLALMTKETSVIFLAGAVAVVVLRGGWRNWRGLLAFLFAAGVIAGPWYIYHRHALRSLATGFTSTGTAAGYSPFAAPPRFSRRNFSWYAWDLINQQVLAPFALLFAIGLVVALVRVIRRRITPQSVEPELLAGVLVSYAGMTYVTNKDPRYTLPMLVYVAVLATGWIPSLTRPWLRRGLSAGVIGLAAIYFVGISTGTGSDVRIRLPGAEQNTLYERQLTLYEPEGYVRGAPIHDADVPGLMSGLHTAGIRGVFLWVGLDPIDFNYAGLQALAQAHGLVVDMPSVPLNQQANLILEPPGHPGPRPCQRLIDGSGIYVIRSPAPGLDPPGLGNPKNPRQRYTFLCPGRAPLVVP